MPRPTRLVLTGVAQHVIQRGNNRHACFQRDSDHLLYLLHLRELIAKYGCALHAYCLMTNHAHLLLTPSTPNGLSALMQSLGQRYAQYVNRTYGRTGTLWEGRFRSCIAESPQYVLACYRYIELNPVRADMVRRPADYPWSSHQANLGDIDDSCISPHPEYLALGQHEHARRSAYRELFDEAIEPLLIEKIREATNAGYPLASESFLSQTAMPSGRKLRRGRPGRPAGESSDSKIITMEKGL